MAFDTLQVKAVESLLSFKYNLSSINQRTFFVFLVMRVQIHLQKFNSGLGASVISQ